MPSTLSDDEKKHLLVVCEKLDEMLFKSSCDEDDDIEESFNSDSLHENLSNETTHGKSKIDALTTIIANLTSEGSEGYP